ncbi:clustered mitochondria protein-like isoform X2 [Hibiscus syriacus]|uniref:Clustered mitochondria protein-like isoform X2 n=1 Tax=Hibiscus syriacus TaxID=106335 RepID=A0A6A2X844_HIBSY|nr:clustered mitochondria protein-like isoform X2 [Hibiscus syriacus]
MELEAASSRVQLQGSAFYDVDVGPYRAAVPPFSLIPPSGNCCNAIKALGQPCLYVLVNGPPITSVDRNMAFQLPQKYSANFEPCDAMK